METRIVGTRDGVVVPVAGTGAVGRNVGNFEGIKEGVLEGKREEDGATVVGNLDGMKDDGC